MKKTGKVMGELIRKVTLEKVQMSSYLIKMGRLKEIICALKKG